MDSHFGIECSQNSDQFLHCCWILDVSLLKISFKNQVTSLQSFFCVFAIFIIQHFQNVSSQCSNLAAIVILRALTVRHKSCCCMTSIIQ